MNTKKVELFYVHALVSILLLGIATSIELSGPTLVIAFIIEALLVIISSYVVTGDSKIANNFAFIMLIPIALSIPSLNAYSWHNGIAHTDFVVLVLMAIATLVLGLFYRYTDKNNTSQEVSTGMIMFVLSSFYAYALLWLCSHSLLKESQDTATFISLFVYTIIGLATHFMGIFKQNKNIKTYGTALLVLVIIRLIFVDIWNMDLALRVVTFIVLGILFISTSFISKKKSITS